MSVPVGKRNEAGSQFCDTARTLHKETLMRTKKWDKAYTFTLKNPACECARTIHLCCIAANKVYVKTAGDFKLRREYLQRAYASACQLDALLEVAQEIMGFSKEKLDYWGKYIGEEKRLLKGVMAADMKRWGEML